MDRKGGVEKVLQLSQAEEMSEIAFRIDYVAL